ncbi:NAD(P)/FAD-dependent oxidoreductase [Nanoarchaeota archaeon]
MADKCEKMKQEDTDHYEIIIVGAGPAGLTAALYAVRYGIPCVVIGQMPGGTIMEAIDVCNWPGEKKISGRKLMDKFIDQINSFNVPIVQDLVVDVEKCDDHFKISTNKQTFKGKYLILATGTERVKLNVPGEEEFLGKGVSYCFTCDGAFFKDKVVGVVGGSDASQHAAQYLAEICEKVYMFVRSTLKGDVIRRKQIEDNPKIKVLLDTQLKEIKGKNFVTSVITNGDHEYKVDGVFIEIGSVPTEVLVKELGLETDKRGFIEINDKSQTNVENVYAAGDSTTGHNGFRQVITACAEASVAVWTIFLERHKE